MYKLVILTAITQLMPFRHLIRFENLQTEKPLKEALKVQIVGEKETFETEFTKRGFQYLKIPDGYYYLKVVFQDKSKMSYQTIIKIDKKNIITIKIP